MTVEKKSVEELIEQFQTEVKTLSETIQKRDDEIKEFGTATEATGKKVDDIGNNVSELTEEINTRAKAQEDRITELEKKANRPGFNAPGERPKSPGEQFVDSEAYKSMAESGRKTSDLVRINNFHQKQAGLDSVTAGALVDPMRVPGVIMPPMRQFRIRDLLTIGTTDVGTIEFVEETGFAPLYAELSAAISAGETDIPVTNIEGFFVGQSIVIKNEGHVVYGLDVDNLLVILESGYGVAADMDEGDPVMSDVFSPTAEGQQKPRMGLKYELKSLATKVIATWIPASKQILEDAGQLQSLIDARLIYALGLTEENEILYGDGSGSRMQGILTHPNVQNYKWSQGTAGDTKVDAIRRAMTYARLAEYPVDGVVLNPVDWEDIELLKGSDKHYIWVTVTMGGEQRVWRVPVVDTTAILAGAFMTGAFSQGATLYDQHLAGVDIAEQHKDYFTKNMVAIRAEERVGLAIFRPEAFVAGEFDSAPPSP